MTKSATNFLAGLASNRRSAAILFLLVIFKALLLFAALPLFMNISASDYQADLFPDGYDQIAWSLASGDGYRMSPGTSLTMVRSPGFVLILAGVFICFGKSLLAVQIVNFAMSLVTAVFVYLIAKKIFGDGVIPRLAALFALFFPGSLIAESRGGVESTLSLCIAAAIYLAYKAEETRRYRDFVTLGIVFGFAVLVKASVAFMLPAFWLSQMATRGASREQFQFPPRYLVASLMIILVSLPWIVRNYEVSGKFVPTMTAGGMALDLGVYIIKNYSFHKQHTALMREQDENELTLAKEMGLKFEGDWYPLFYRTIDEYTFYKRIGDDALMEYYRSPSLTAKAILINSLAFWFQGRTHSATIINIAVGLPVLVLFCGGVLTARRRRCNYYVPALSSLIAYVLPHLLILALARYYIPIMPLISIFAAAFLVDFGEKHFNRMLPAHD